MNRMSSEDDDGDDDVTRLLIRWRMKRRVISPLRRPGIQLLKKDFFGSVSWANLQLRSHSKQSIYMISTGINGKNKGGQCLYEFRQMLMSIWRVLMIRECTTPTVIFQLKKMAGGMIYRSFINLLHEFIRARVLLLLNQQSFSQQSKSSRVVLV